VGSSPAAASPRATARRLSSRSLLLRESSVDSVDIDLLAFDTLLVDMLPTEASLVIFFFGVSSSDRSFIALLAGGGLAEASFLVLL
jgi:hypothetical protein